MLSSQSRLWTAAGCLFLAAGAYNTWLEVSTFGWEQGTYSWLCNGALFVIAWGLLTRDRSWLIGFLGISYTQLVWVADNLWRFAFGRTLFGLTEYMYQPGASMARFTMSHYHYFMIPAAAAALFFLEGGRKGSKAAVVAINAVLFGVAYFLFPESQNVNCIHQSCFPFLSVKGPVYAFVWSFGLTALAAGLCHLIEKNGVGLGCSAKTKRRVLALWAASAVFGAVVTAADVSYKKSLPSFACRAEAPAPGWEITCRYVADSPGQQLIVSYYLRSKSDKPLVCRTTMNEEVMEEGVALSPGMLFGSDHKTPYPDRDLVGVLKAECR